MDEIEQLLEDIEGLSKDLNRYIMGLTEDVTDAVSEAENIFNNRDLTDAQSVERLKEIKTAISSVLDIQPLQLNLDLYE
jgi:BioD-like phosphotransacetylase family protein